MLFFAKSELVEIHIQYSLPACVCLFILRNKFLVRLNDIEFLKSGESLVMILIDTCTQTCTLGCTYRAVSVIKFNGSTCYAGQSIAEYRIQEHVGVAGMDL